MPFPIVASDPDAVDQGKLKYFLESCESDSEKCFDFSISQTTGQLSIASGAEIDYESKPTYELPILQSHVDDAMKGALCHGEVFAAE